MSTKLRQNNCVVIAVDYQEKILPAMQNREQLMTNSIKFLRCATLLQLPVIITEQYPKGLGTTVPEILEAAPEAKVYAKESFSALGAEEILTRLDADKTRKRVIVLGIEAHVCVLQTALDLTEKGYKPYIVGDCIDSRKQSDMMIALIRAEREGVRFVSTEMVAFEVMGGKQHPQFRAVSALIK